MQMCAAMQGSSLTLPLFFLFLFIFSYFALPSKITENHARKTFIKLAKLH